MLVLLYGREGWFAPVIRASGYNVVFAFPGRVSPLAGLLCTLTHVCCSHPARAATSPLHGPSQGHLPKCNPERASCLHAWQRQGACMRHPYQT